MAVDLYEKNEKIKKVLEESDKIMKEKYLIENLYRDKMFKSLNEFYEKEKNIIELNKKNKDLDEKNYKLESENINLNYYKKVIDVDISTYNNTIEELEKENKQLKEDYKNYKDPQLRKNIQDDLTKNREEIDSLKNQINKLENEKKNITYESNKHIFNQSGQLAEYQNRLKLNEYSIKTYNDKLKKYEDIEIKYNQTEQILNQLKLKNNDLEQQITNIRNIIGQYEKNNAIIYNDKNLPTLENKLENIFKILENSNLTLINNNEDLIQQLSILNEKYKDIPVLQSQINELLTKNEHLNLITDKESNRYKELKNNYDNKVKELENNITNIRKLISDKIKNDDLYHIDNKELKQFIEFINKLFNIPSMDLIFESFPSDNKSDNKTNEKSNEKSNEKYGTITE